MFAIVELFNKAEGYVDIGYPEDLDETFDEYYNEGRYEFTLGFKVWNSLKIQEQYETLLFDVIMIDDDLEVGCADFKPSFL